MGRVGEPMPILALQPKPPARARAGSSFAALWVADVPSWAAQRLDPALEGRAVIVADGRRVLGANALARAARVRVGDALDRARGLCPDGVLVPYETAMIEAAWESALSRAYHFTPYLEPLRAGLAYLGGLSPLEAEALAQELGVRVGLAPSRGTALLAALCARERQARTARDEATFLEAVPVYVLRGAGIEADVIERLKLFGFRTLGNLRARVQAAQFAAYFGPRAAQLWSLAHGLETSPVSVFEPPIEISASFEFELPAAEPCEWAPALERCASLAVNRLGERLAGSVTVTLRSQLGLSSARRVLKDFTRDVRSVRLAAHQALEAALPGLELLALTVTLGSLHHLMPYQDSLFEVLERPHVREAIRAVHRRFPEGIGRFEPARAQAYLPEHRFRFVPLSGEVVAPPKKRRGRGKARGR